MMSIIMPNYDDLNVYLMTGITKKYFPQAEIIVIDDFQSKGKGWATREGFKQATGDPIIFLDCDLDIHPKMINRLLPFLEDYDIVVGRKKIDRGLIKRRILTFLSRLYIRVMFGLKVDTQTGIKVFKRKALSEWKTDGYAFDVEILSNAKQNGYTMVEVPIDATINKQMKWIAILRTLKETLKIRFLS